MKIVAFGASNNKRSINKQLATYAAHQINKGATEVIDLNDYQAPLFSVDLEEEQGHPQVIHDFVNKLDEADLLVISMAENNGSYTVAFKNLLDWGSRVKPKLLSKKMLLLSTSDGKRGGQFVMEAALTRFPRHGAEIVAHFSLPSFHETFDPEKGILDAELKVQFDAAIEEVKRNFDQV